MTYTQPILLLGLFAMLVALVRLPGGGRKRWPFVCLLGLFLVSWPPFAWLCSHTLEAGYPVRPFTTDSPPQAIVVLSAAVFPPHFERPYALLDPSTFERCSYAAWLAHRWPGAPLLVSGGPMAPQAAPLSEAMRQFLATQTPPSTTIWTENQSHNTYENAVYSTAILKEHGIGTVALVVDATSMPRAAACFRNQGMNVLPAPSRFHERPSLSEALLPGWKAIQQNEDTLHEILGLLWYRLRGRI